MKLMVVGHPFLFAYNQKKYVAMKRLDPGLRLRLVVPGRWRERFDWRECEVHPALSREEVVPLRAWPGGWHMWHMHNPARLAALLREFQPDVIHLDPGEPQALISVEMITLRRLFAGTAAVTLMTVDNLLRRRRFPLGLIKNGLRAYSLSRTTSMISINQRGLHLLNAEGRFRGPVDLVPQFGLDVGEHQPGKNTGLRRELGLEDAPVIGYLGRLVPQKGLRLLFEALLSLQSHRWNLLLVGSGPMENEIREQWMTPLSRRIVLVPAVPYEQVMHYLRCADIFVLPSYRTPSWAEQFGLTLAQAMMLGIPCIGSTSGAIPEVLGPGGVCFAEGSARDLRRVLEDFLLSQAQREEFGMRGRQFALENYTAEKVAEKHLAFFEHARQARSPQSAVEECVEFPALSRSRRSG